MDIEAFRRNAYAAVDQICEYYTSLPSQAVQSTAQPGYIKDLLPNEPPQDCAPFEEVVKDFERVVLPGYGGVIQGSASEALLVITVAARERAFSYYSSPSLGPSLRREPDEIRSKLVMYGSTETHSGGKKTAIIFGVKYRALKVEMEDGLGLRGETLRRAVEEDVANGLVPFLVVVTVGATNAGSIDFVSEIVAVSRDYPSLFVHVDSAWGGVYLACPENRVEARLEEINAFVEGDGAAAGQVHSFSTNVHKAGLIALEATCLWIRERKMLTDALSITPPYLRSAVGDQGTVIDYRNWNLGLGRRFRSLKILFILRSYGISGFQAHLRRHCDLASRFESYIRSSSSFSLFTPRRWGLVVFRLIDPNMNDEGLNTLNKKFYAAIEQDRDIMISSTIINGVYCIRLAVGGPSTREEHVDKAWALIQLYAERTLAARNPAPPN
ncbi:PLP-dependent transferase [Atractiella rhizophila]|nr:PLP-dependent transferase [Atractiella rhizophila]